MPDSAYFFLPRCRRGGRIAAELAGNILRMFAENMVKYPS